MIRRRYLASTCSTILHSILLALVAVSLIIASAGAGRSAEALARPVYSQRQPALSGRALDNLVAFTRLFGYIRYFHPSDAVEATDWDSFAIHNVESVEGARDPPSLAAKLQLLFAPYAPTVQVFVTGQIPPPLPAALDTSSGVPVPAGRHLFVTHWVHIFFGSSGRTPQPPSQRVSAELQGGNIPAGYLDPRHPYLANLGGGVSASVPLTLVADDQGTLPHTEIPAPIPAPLGANHATWLADIAIIWNAIQHFYTYFDAENFHWDRALGDALFSAAAAPNESAFYHTLRRLMARLDDGHAFVSRANDETPAYALPLLWDWIQNRLIVVSVKRAQAGMIGRGDQILRIDGRSVKSILDAPENVTGGTPAYRRHVVLRTLVAGRRDSKVTLMIRTRSGQERTVSLRRTAKFNQATWLLEPRPLHAVTQLRPGIMYLDLTRVSTTQFDQALPRLVAARGIVLDQRGYPTSAVLFGILGHLSTEPLHTAPLLIPIVTYPDHQDIAYQDAGFAIAPLPPHLKARMVFLINSNDAVSQAETVLSIVEGYRLGALVGSHTAGTDGDFVGLKLPGGYTVTWTGMRATKLDGSQLMHVGVLPTVRVERTIKGVIAGRDEVLERGVQVLKQELGSADRPWTLRGAKDP